MNRPSLLLRGAVIGSCIAASVVVACSSDGGSSSGSSGSSGSGGDAAADRRLPAPFRPMASCPVVIESPALLPSPHVPEGTAVTYNSNPPSSGQHYPVWANFQEFNAPLAEGYLVHSLEHGAVALLYKCSAPTDPACAANVEALRKIRESIATDPRCDSAVRVRVIIAPAPNLEMPVAAAAWGWTYKADCVDVPTLTQFVKDNYAMSPEDVCAAGRAFP